MTKPNFYPHPRFNKVYKGTMLKDVRGTIGNSNFKAGEEVLVVIGITARQMGDLIAEAIKKWRRDAGGQWVMCDDVQDQINWEEVVMKDDNNFSVWVIDTLHKRDNQYDFNEIKEDIKLTGKIVPTLDPERIARNVIYLHNRRVD